MRMSKLLVLPALAALACGDKTQAADTTSSGATTAAVGQTTQATTAGEVQQGDLIDPNTATAQQLIDAGVDSASAAALIAGRPYADMIAVNRALAKLSAEQRKAVYTKVWKPIDLNTAKGEEILLIPGVGARMRREFEEYRPYTNIEQFRREMGKYVDKAEVARLERYVVVK